jgi:hypothetical protein
MHLRALLTLAACCHLAMPGIVLASETVPQPPSTPAVAEPSDELFWAGGFDQAVAMARATGRPIFLQYFTLVDERSETYSGDRTVC